MTPALQSDTGILDALGEAWKGDPNTHDPGGEGAPVEAAPVPVDAGRIGGVEVSEFVNAGADDEVICEHYTSPGGWVRNC